MSAVWVLLFAFSLWIGAPCVDAKGYYSYDLHRRMNSEYMNPNCTHPGENYIPCQDIRLCNLATASLSMGGWPTLCGWVGKGVPKVCCGIPLVLGAVLAKKVNEERARNLKCGVKITPDFTEIEQRLYGLQASIPPVNIFEADKYDPPLDLNDEFRISVVGGRKAKQGDYPWMVSIRKLGKHWCGGTLIDRKHVLSAAHCFVNDRKKPDISDYMASIGDIDIAEGNQFAVAKITIHPQYDPSYHYYDMAMLTLTEEVLIPELIHICLPTPRLSAVDLTGHNTSVLGWGDTSFNGKGSPVLQVASNLPVVSNSDCKQSYSRFRSQLPYGVTEDLICAGEQVGGRDACQSDSGGPLMYKDNPDDLPSYYPDIPWVLVGVVSFGLRCGEPGYPGVYSRVSSHMDWIMKEMNE